MQKRLIFRVFTLLILFAGLVFLLLLCPRVALAEGTAQAGVDFTIFRHNLPSELKLNEEVSLNLTLQNVGEEYLQGENLQLRHVFTNEAGQELGQPGVKLMPAGRVLRPATVSLDLNLKAPSEYSKTCRLQISLQTRQGETLDSEFAECKLEYVPPKPPIISPTPGNPVWQRPYIGETVITSPFGPRWGSFHKGTDYGLSCGTDLFAVRSGTVVAASNAGVVLGNSSSPSTPASYIIIQHKDGWQSYYWHLNRVFVSYGQFVKQGQMIGLSGNTGYVRGSNSSPVQYQGCHLHFELRENGIPKDPEEIFRQSVN